MGKTSTTFAILLALLASACSHSPSALYLARYGPQNSLSSFHVCRDYGCSLAVEVSLEPEEWSQVRALFAPSSTGPAEEREQIAKAIALIETLVGPKAGTANDLAGARLFRLGAEGQLDCIDEAYNTSAYLELLDADRLLVWHDVGEPSHRGYFIDRWPHNTATIIEHDTGAQYTVDSWFHANGELPEVVPLQTWLDGWSPENA